MVAERQAERVARNQLVEVELNLDMMVYTAEGRLDMAVDKLYQCDRWLDSDFLRTLSVDFFDRSKIRQKRCLRNLP